MLNACWTERKLIHWCHGFACCPKGRTSTVSRIVSALLSTVFRRSPIVSELSKWTKGIASLDFWLPALGCHQCILHCVSELFVQPDGQAQSKSLKDVLADIDPAALEDSTKGFQALNGLRVRTTMDTLSRPTPHPLLWVLSLVMGGLRYVTKLLGAIVRSVRAKAQASGHVVRPPLLDLVNPRYSTVAVFMDFFQCDTCQ